MGQQHRFGLLRDLETIDSELRLLAAVRWSIREHDGEPSSRLVNELLDERIIRLSHLRQRTAMRLPDRYGGTLVSVTFDSQIAASVGSISTTDE
jgi:hypothetical protein